MHSLWDNVHGMTQHLNWRHRGEVQERKRGRAVTSHSGCALPVCFGQVYRLFFLNNIKEDLLIFSFPLKCHVTVYDTL